MVVEELFRTTQVSTVHAFIKPHNEASIRAFEKAGFRKIDMETVRGSIALHYTKVRSL